MICLAVLINWMYVLNVLKTNRFFPGSHIQLFKKLVLSNIYENKINIRVKTNCFLGPYYFCFNKCLANRAFQKVQYGCQEKNGLFSDRLERTLCEINSSRYFGIFKEHFYMLSNRENHVNFCSKCFD